MKFLGLLLALTGCGEATDEQDDVIYDVRFGVKTSMDFYLPPKRDVGRPGVMLVHGGSWTGGSKGDFTEAARRLARSGYVAASIDYRLGDDGAFPKDVQDVGCALSFMRARAAEIGLDPARLAVMGYSAGGHLVSLMALGADDLHLRPDCDAGFSGRPAAVIDGAGPAGFLTANESSVLDDYLGGPRAQHLDTWSEASPVNHVFPGAPPFLIVNGGGDWLVPLSQAQELHDALVKNATFVRLLVVNGGGHLLQPEPDGDEAIEVSTDADVSWLAISDFLSTTVGRP